MVLNRERESLPEILHVFDEEGCGFSQARRVAAPHTLRIPDADELCCASLRSPRTRRGSDADALLHLRRIQAAGGLIAMSGRRVLLVEDYADTRELYAEALRLAGYVVDEAIDGASALQRVCAVHPELILLDIGLPGMDGFEVAAELRKNAALAGVPIVMLSAYVTSLNKAEMARRAGAVVALPKPCSPDELLSAVARIFAGQLD